MVHVAWVSIVLELSYVQLEADMVAFKNCSSPKSTNDHITDGAHKLVFVMCSGDTHDISATDIVLSEWSL